MTTILIQTPKSLNIKFSCGQPRTAGTQCQTCFRGQRKMKMQTGNILIAGSAVGVRVTAMAAMGIMPSKCLSKAYSFQKNAKLSRTKGTYTSQIPRLQAFNPKSLACLRNMWSVWHSWSPKLDTYTVTTIPKPDSS